MKDQPDSSATRGALCGLAAAVLFGLSAPISKLLLTETPPLLLAALLYLGAALGLLFAAPFMPRQARREAPLRRSDLPLLAAVVVTGGIIGPVLMLTGLQRVSGLTGSLLLNLEAPLTVLIALLFFREHLSRLEGVSAMLIIGGAAALAYGPGEFRAHWIGVLCIAGACLSWALDNNWTQRLSVKDPFAVVRAKALGAGTCNLILALALGQRIASARAAAAALVLGAFSYGISILLDAYALRLIGAAREAAFFAAAPFIGAMAAMLLLGDHPRPLDVAAMLTMAAGVAVLLRVRHGHKHTHAVIEHEHVHVHEEHHRHMHSSSDPPGEPHSHSHAHEPVTHDHPHASDIHHRHQH